MTTKIAKIVDQTFRLVFVVRNVACHRSLEKNKNHFHQNYWTLIYNNFLDMAVLEWCKVFGSRNERTHWSKHIKDHDTFRNGLLTRLNINEKDWKKYWDNTKNYRDNAVAHHGDKPTYTNYPDFDYAL